MDERLKFTNSNKSLVLNDFRHDLVLCKHNSFEL